MPQDVEWGLFEPLIGIRVPYANDQHWADIRGQSETNDLLLVTCHPVSPVPNHYLEIEHLMRLAKARARQLLAHG